ncbi:hypothetical protein [Melittangium boletus]|uniref:hypothetical protein n=1 Tax=Melittangium boletus TaxID=83453 RepID=UPI003DA4A879
MPSLRSLVLSCLVVSGVLTACGDSTLPPPVDPPEVPEPVTCDTVGVTLCENACVNTTNNPVHCGGCGKACVTGEVCTGGACIATCQIDGQRIFEGTLNAANACERCAPATSTTAWTPLADGTSCASGQICVSGACGAQCLIDGVAHAEGAVNPANACERCAPATSTTAWTPLADGTSCASGQICVSGACGAQCLIDGVAHAEGAVNPANACERCAPATSTTAWTPLAEGTSCASGQICVSGACSAQCLIDGVAHAEGAVNPANACEVCTPATSTTAWTARESVPLLVGGRDITAQGWTTVSGAPYTLTYGEDYVRLSTSTASGGRTSGQLLIWRANAFDPMTPSKLRVVMLVEAVNRHNTLDSGAAILGSFTPPYGNSTDRSQMIYLDDVAIGWADETQAAQAPVTDGAYHVYEFALDAQKKATVSVDGVAKLTRGNFTTTGTLALGDQTNDPNVDGTVRIKSVERMCP